MNEEVIHESSVRMGKPSMSEYHYSSPSSSITDSWLGMEEEVQHLFTWTYGNQNLPAPSRALEKQLLTDHWGRTCLLGEAVRIPGLSYPGSIKTRGRQSQPKLTNPSKQNQAWGKVGTEILCNDFISEHTSHVPWRRMSIFFFTFSLAKCLFPS